MYLIGGNKGTVAINENSMKRKREEREMGQVEALPGSHVPIL